MSTTTAQTPPVNAEQSDAVINIDERIHWHHSPIDKKLLAQLMERSDWRGFRQLGLHLGLLVITGTVSFVAWQHHAWLWMIVTLYAHGTFYAFFGTGVAGHELTHRTVFKTRALNDSFAWLASFMGWANHVWFRTSHVKHHQLTVYKDLDLEVILPQKLTWYAWLFAFTINPLAIYQLLRLQIRRSLDLLDGEWDKRLFENEPQLRRQLSHCARFVLLTHLALAAVFIYFHLWIMLLLVTFAPFYATWLALLCGFPQHAGLQPGVPDFRLCTRTMILSPFVSFLYWQMNYHIEHHMYAAVPFFNLGKLGGAIESDLPPAPRGLRATWEELLPVLRRQKEDPNYVFVPPLPTPKAA